MLNCFVVCFDYVLVCMGGLVSVFEYVWMCLNTCRRGFGRSPLHHQRDAHYSPLVVYTAVTETTEAGTA